jgi:hypothetical protein
MNPLDSRAFSARTRALCNVPRLPVCCYAWMKYPLTLPSKPGAEVVPSPPSVPPAYSPFGAAHPFGAAQRKQPAPTAPPVYRPLAPASGAPPVYRPHAPAQARLASSSAAPPVYSPYSVPLPKNAVGFRAGSGPPPVYRPAATAQLKAAVLQARGVGGVIQMKCGHCGEGGHTTKNCPYPADDGPPVVPESNEVKAPPKPRKTPGGVPKNIPKELVFTVAPPVPTVVRPAFGTTLTDLENMAGVKDKFPATFAATMAAVGGYTVTDLGTLSGGKGTAKETREWKVERNGLFFVVHFHPNVVIPPGAQNGDSRVHVKGSRGVTHHENMAEEFLPGLGIHVT